MLKKFSYSIISLSIFATSLNFIDTQAQASSSSVSEKGTMGYGYQQYLKDHPKKQPQSNLIKHKTVLLSLLKLILLKQIIVKES